jgi:hypothetical protein
MAAPTGILFADPRVKPTNTAGQPQSGCYYVFYSTGTTTPVSVYADGFLTVPLSQPPAASVNPVGFGTIAASDGRFVPFYLNPAITYRAQLYGANGALLEDTDPYVVPGSGGAASTAPPYYPQTALEIAASVTPTSYNSAAINNWAYIDRYGGSLAVALLVASTNQMLLYIDEPIQVAANTTIPSNVSLSFIGNGSITTTAGNTLTVNGPVFGTEPLTTLFQGSGTTNLSPTSANAYANYNLQLSGNLLIGQGVLVGAATGGLQGAGTVNAAGFYVNGVLISGNPAAIRSTFKNLNIATTGSNSTFTGALTVTADEVLLENPVNNQYITVRNLNLTAVNPSSSGSSTGNDLDAGTLAGNTWYYVWIIYNPTTLTVGGLISASSTTPTLPTGYTFCAMVGAIVTQALSPFYMLHTLQQGRQLRFITGGAGTNTLSLPLVVNGAVGSLTAYPVRGASGATAYVPPIASTITLMLGIATNGQAALNPNATYGSQTAFGTASGPWGCWSSPGGSSMQVPVEMALESNSVYYECSTASGPGGYISVYGCELNI